MTRFFKTVISTVMAIMLLLSGLGTQTGIASAAAAKVTAHEARQAAAWQVITEANTEKDGHWSNKKLKLDKAVEVYDPAGNHVAYLVNVIADGQPAGYVMVSAFLDEEPILAWADTGQAFDPEKVKNKLGEKASKVASKQVVWLGGIRFAGKFKLNDGTSRLVDVMGIEAPDDLEDAYPTPKSENAHARQFWGIVKKIRLGKPGESNPSDGVTDIDPVNWETNYLSISKNYIDTYVNQKQWYYTTINGVPQATGCSPTAGSNIMKYWADKGKSGLNPTNNQRDIVMALRTTMKTTQGSDGTGITDPRDISGGLQTYARDRGYSNAWSTSIYLANFSDYVTEIDNGRIALQSYWNQKYFGDHTVTVVGYKRFVRSWQYPDSYYIVVRNNFINDSTFNLYVKWGTWNANQLTKFWFAQ